MAQARQVLRQYREFADAAPEELAVWAVLRQAPPLPFLPGSAHGQGMIALALLYVGDPEAGKALIRPLRGFGTPLGEHVGVQPYLAWQQTFDPLLAPGARNYWKSHNFTELKEGLFDAVVDFAGRLPSPQCEIFLGALGGATCRPAPEGTAYAHREVRFVMNVHGRWENPDQDEVGIGWSRDFFRAATPYASGGVYVNFLTADEGERIPSAYGANYARLAQIKRSYDPDNLFRLNQNITPA
jgi:FAD/FMN-containing dehydrogenase